MYVYDSNKSPQTASALISLECGWDQRAEGRPALLLGSWACICCGHPGPSPSQVLAALPRREAVWGCLVLTVTDHICWPHRP
jgi:hypothetical protein